MGIKKFIDSVIESLGLDDFEMSGKRKSLKALLKKLKAKKDKLTKLLDKKLDKKDKKEKRDELEIISLQIRKGEKILDELDSKKK